MTERNIAAEVLEGLRETREHRAGRHTLKTVHVEPRPLPELTPQAIRGVREHLDVSRAVFATHDPRPHPHRRALGARPVVPPPDSAPQPSSSWPRSTRTLSSAWPPCSPPGPTRPGLNQ